MVCPCRGARLPYRNNRRGLQRPGFSATVICTLSMWAAFQTGSNRALAKRSAMRFWTVPCRGNDRAVDRRSGKMRPICSSGPCRSAIFARGFQPHTGYWRTKLWLPEASQIGPKRSVPRPDKDADAVLVGLQGLFEILPAGLLARLRGHIVQAVQKALAHVGLAISFSNMCFNGGEGEGAKRLTGHGAREEPIMRAERGICPCKSR